MKLLSAIWFTTSLMNPRNRIAHNNQNSRRTKAISLAAIPVAGTIVAIALISGLVLVAGSYYQPAIAQQQNITGSTASTTGGSSNGGGSTSSSSACTPTQTGASGGTQGNMTGSPMNSSPSANSLTGGTTTGGGSTANSGVGTFGGGGGSSPGPGIGSNSSSG
jgi:hypothetical protein